jgi:hypothetical protein
VSPVWNVVLRFTSSDHRHGSAKADLVLEGYAETYALRQRLVVLHRPRDDDPRGSVGFFEGAAREGPVR